jgi:uncharacterized membrane protein
MTGIIILVILIPVVIIILLAGIHSKTSAQQELLESLNEKFNKLNDRLNELSKGEIEKKQAAETKTAVVKEEIIRPATETPKAPEPVPAILQKEKEAEPVPVSIPEIKKQDVKQEELAAIEENFIPYAESKERKTDFEKFIGENLINKIGIAILILGISFFVKYAIDKNWIREGNRVIIGLICGAILIGIAHRIRNQYRAFSSVLAGGGLAVFYFSIAFAFHQYHLIDQQAAFIIMIVITALGVLLSLLYDRLELSILATIGGFITPFLVSTGNNNYIALFTYLSILNSGLMVLAWFKKWPAIHFIALFFTIIIYGGWLVNGGWFRYNHDLPYKPALLFATIFYLQFIAMNIIHNLRMKRTFQSLDFIVVLGVNFLFYAAGMVILDSSDHENYQGIFTASVTVFSFLLLLIFRNRKSVDRNFVHLLTGLTISFASLFAPVELEGNYITLFWAAEMVVLFWLFTRSGLKLMKVASLILAGLMFISLFIDWADIYLSGDKVIPVVINKGFITSVAVAAALFIYHRLVYLQANSFYLGNITNILVRNCFITASIAILYLAGLLEVYFQFSSRFELPLHIIYLLLYTLLFAIVLLRIYSQSAQLLLIRFSFTVFCLVLYFLYCSNTIELSFILSKATSQTGYFAGHWIAALLLLLLLYELVQFYRQHRSSWIVYQSHFSWLMSGLIIAVFSIEAYHILVWTNYGYDDNWFYAENLYYKAGLTILWSVCSFIMMWLGMKYRIRILRIISLTLFTVILIKLFAYDIRNIPPGGKIAAFILLGVLLLVVSFMYQRLKKIIIDDSEEEKNFTK